MNMEKLTCMECIYFGKRDEKTKEIFCKDPSTEKWKSNEICNIFAYKFRSYKAMCFCINEGIKDSKNQRDFDLLLR